MQLTIPELSLVVLIGASGSGKSTFAARHFRATEVISSDFCRGLVADDENEQSATGDAFEVLHYITSKRLAGGRLTVVDATNVQPESRRPLVEIARKYHAMPVAIVLGVPESVSHERNAGRADRAFGPHVVRRQVTQLRRGLRGLQREGFRYVHVLDTPEAIDGATVVRQRMWTDRRNEHGPFDMIGDVHGCFDELVTLLEKLGYELTPESDVDGVTVITARHSGGRKAVFLGDLVDRGPNTPGVLRLVMRMVADGTAICVPGNHENKLLRKLNGRNVQITHGIAESIEQMEQQPDGFSERVAAFIDGLVSHYVLDEGKLVVCHAGLKAEMQGRASNAVREFALYGETTGETDEYGLPVRYNWASEYRGSAMVVYGHTPVPEAEWLNNTICLDTGCVFGGELTALRYPERERVSVPAMRQYYDPVRPLREPTPAADAARPPALLDLGDVLGKRPIQTALRGAVMVREQNAAAALEVMSRFAIDPRWLVYLPPTMSPPGTSGLAGLLEHPAEAFDYYRQEGIVRVICEEKHMGSRAVVVICRDEGTASKRFGVGDGAIGACYTRTGRAFFGDAKLERTFLERVRRAVTTAGWWEAFETSWVVLDCELMPWSAKAEALIRQQYASVGAAGRAALPAAEAAVAAAAGRIEGLGDLLARTQSRLSNIRAFDDAYGRYCWPTEGLDGIKLAPFHLLASEGTVHANRDNRWHMEQLAALAGADPMFVATPFRVVDVTEPAEVGEAVAWWEELTAAGGEGMVVKPLDFVARGPRGIVQPAVKCRGAEYLRIIYGPDYQMEKHLTRLRIRSLGAKRSLALREFALGIEGLDRFVRHEPLYRVHECAFAVLALESEPVDPRL